MAVDPIIKSVENSWPHKFLDLAGAFTDFPDADDLRKGYGEDVPRESLGLTLHDTKSSSTI